MKLLPCWRVDVRHKRISGVRGHFRSRPMTWTEARELHAEYASTGTQVSIECIEELAALHRKVIANEYSYEYACEIGRQLGYEV